MKNQIFSAEDERKKIVDELVDELPKLRKSLGLSQTKLGEMVGLSRQTISLIERKQMPLTWNNYLAIVCFFAINSKDVYYFPKTKGYKNHDILVRLMGINN